MIFIQPSNFFSNLKEWISLDYFFHRGVGSAIFKVEFFWKGSNIPTRLHTYRPTDLQTYRPTCTVIFLSFLSCCTAQRLNTIRHSLSAPSRRNMKRWWGTLFSQTQPISAQDARVRSWFKVPESCTSNSISATDRSGRPDRAVHIDLAPHFGKDRGRDYMYEPKPVLE